MSGVPVSIKNPKVCLNYFLLNNTEDIYRIISLHSLILSGQGTKTLFQLD